MRRKKESTKKCKRNDFSCVLPPQPCTRLARNTIEGVKQHLLKLHRHPRHDAAGAGVKSKASQLSPPSATLNFCFCLLYLFDGRPVTCRVDSHDAALRKTHLCLDIPANSSRAVAVHLGYFTWSLVYTDSRVERNVPSFGLPFPWQNNSTSSVQHAKK